MDMSSLIYYGLGGCVVFLGIVIVINFSVNVLIKQFTERALHNFQERLAQAVDNALADFQTGVVEQMALQESKSDSLAKLYSALIDLVRDGKGFVSSTGKSEPLVTDKTLRTLVGTSRLFFELNRKQSLHFSDDFRAVMEGFMAEQEATMLLFETHWNSNSRDPQEVKLANEQIRQAWTKFEDRVAAIMELMRHEFRNRT